MNKKTRSTGLKLIALIMSIVLLLSGCGDAEYPSAEPVAEAVESSEAALENAESSDATIETKEGSEAATDGSPEYEEPPDATDDISEEAEEPPDTSEALDIDGTYTTKEDVSLYIHIYGHLPSNFITKKEARSLGWEGGSLDEYANGKCIGGDHFGNYEKLLPEKKGREYKECDINTLHKKKRGPERLAFSNDGLIYYTPDHYETWEQLY